MIYRFASLFKKKEPIIDSVLHLSIISSKQYMLSRLLRKHGIKSAFFALNGDIAGQIALGHDYHLPYRIKPVRKLLLEIYYLWAVLSRYDVIHFHFNTFLSMDNGWELEYLKKMGKVLVFHFRGCDLRQKSKNMETNPALNCCMECDYPDGSCDTEYQRMRIAMAKRYGDLFFVTTPDLRDFLPEAEHIPFISPFGIDLDELQPAPKKDGVFRVVTSSNHPGVDGVGHIRKAVRRLSDEGYSIELVEVIKQPLFEALSIYKSADLYAGKLLMGYYNNANIETMMMGVPNMAYIRDAYRPGIPDCPIIVARTDNIHEKLREWIQKPEELKRIGALGPAFVKKYHDPDRIIQVMLDRYNSEWKRKADRGAMLN